MISKSHAKLFAFWGLCYKAFMPDCGKREAPPLGNLSAVQPRAHQAAAGLPFKNKGLGLLSEFDSG